MIEKRTFTTIIIALILVSTFTFTCNSLQGRESTVGGNENILGTTPGTDQTVPRTTRAGDVVINEFLPDANSDWDGSGALDYNDDEWIELYNKGNSRQDLSGWRLDDITAGGTDHFTISGGTGIDPGEILVFFGSDTGVGLNNAGDTVNLLNELGTVIDSYSYDHSSDDISYARIPDGADIWEEVASPTPGERNSAVDLDNSQTLVVDDNYPTQAKDMIDNAKSYIFVLQYMAIYYPTHPEYPVSKLYQSLINAHSRGVEVKILLDDTPQGNIDTKIYLENNGLTVKIDDDSLKLHSKLIIADDKVLLGSTNWGHKSTTGNHEANLKLNSTPIGKYFKVYFEELWLDPTIYPSPSPPDTGEISTVICDEYYAKADNLITSAQNQICLVMYHITEAAEPRALLQKIIDAHLRGVSVRVILEHTTFIDYVDIDNMAALEILLENGVPSVLDEDSMNTHAKVLVVDDEVLLGSTNWAYEAFSSQLNTNLLVNNASLTRTVIDYFDGLWERYGSSTGGMELSGGTGEHGLDFYSGDTVTVTVTDEDTNINETLQEELKITVSSDSDPVGISITLPETGSDTGTYGDNFYLSSVSDQARNEIEGKEGDSVTVVYHDLMDVNATARDVEISFVIMETIGSISLLHPLNNSLVTQGSSWFNWSLEYSGSGLLSYDLCVDVYSSPSFVVASSISDSSFFLDGLEDGLTYYWKVIPVVDGSRHSWESDVRTFTVDIQGMINPVTPADESILESDSVKLEWDYNYQGDSEISFEIYFGTSEGSLEVLSSDISEKYFHVRDLEDGGTYYWKVVPLVDGIQGNWESQLRSFTIEFTGEILPVSPLEGEIVEESSPELCWNYSYNGTGMLKFNVYMGTETENMEKIASSVLSNKTRTDPLLDGKTYTWKIMPVLNGEEKKWGSTNQSFTVKLSGDIELLSPDNGFIITKSEVLLEWELDYQGTGEVVFSVFLDDKQIPTKEILSKSTDTSFTADELKDGKKYYWFVQPYLDDEKVSWISPVWNFTVKLEKTTSGDDDNDGGGGNDVGSGSNTAVIILIVLILTILVIVIIIIVVMRKNKKNGEDEGEPTPYGTTGYQNSDTDHGIQQDLNVAPQTGAPTDYNPTGVQDGMNFGSEGQQPYPYQEQEPPQGNW